MTYDDMEVAAGEQAGLVWDALIRREVGDADKKRLRGALLAYCRQDTLALARLLKTLQTKFNTPDMEVR